MAQRFSPSQVLKNLRAGPGRGEPPTAHQVAFSSAKYPPQYGRVLSTLFYKMADEQMRRVDQNVVSRYQQFSEPWRGHLNDDASRFYFASLDAYAAAVQAGLQKLDHSTKAAAEAVASRLSSRLPTNTSVEGMAWRALLGQVQSVYSRDEAAETFIHVRQHSHVALIPLFYRDTGALTYFCEEEVEERKRPLPPLSVMSSWSYEYETDNPQAVVISVDANFFRIYGPMILFNAQQLPDLDFVIVLCAAQQDSTELQRDMMGYLEALSEFNKQNVPKNVRVLGVETPPWVENEVTFYASVRFLAVPELLEHYDSLYVMDADLFLREDPERYLQRYHDLTIGVPLTRSLAGVCPWRRHMAGSLIANKRALNGPFLSRLLDYLSVGLSESKSWMLDQNALSYAVEGIANEYLPLTRGLPVVTGSIMGTWERNYKMFAAT